MKATLKKIISAEVWDFFRTTYSKTRRLFLDVLVTASSNPISWARVFFLIRTVRPFYSMVPAARLRLLHDLSQAVDKDKIRGSIVECGVYNGGSAAVMKHAQKNNDRDIWLFDSFQGLPKPTEDDGDYERKHFYDGWCEGSPGNVRKIFTLLGLSQEKLHIVEGWFCDSFSARKYSVGPIALINIDSDWYESVKICLETWYPHLSSGGYIVFDDYGKYPGCKKAVDEYLAKHGIEVKLETRDSVGRYFRKP